MRGRGQRGVGSGILWRSSLAKKKIDIFNRCAVGRPIFEKLHACKAVEWKIIRMWSGAFGKLPLQVKVHVCGRGFLSGSNGARVETTERQWGEGQKSPKILKMAWFSWNLQDMSVGVQKRQNKKKIRKNPFLATLSERRLKWLYFTLDNSKMAQIDQWDLEKQFQVRVNPKRPYKLHFLA